MVSEQKSWRALWPWKRVKALQAKLDDAEATVRHLQHMLTTAQINIEDLNNARTRLIIIAKARKKKLKELNVNVQELDRAALDEKDQFDEDLGKFTQNRGGEAHALEELPKGLIGYASKQVSNN